MNRTICAKVEQGIETLVRVTNTLRRKEFQIKSLAMAETERGYSDLTITLEEGVNLGIEQAIMQMKKMVQVYDVKELKEGN